MKVAEDLDSKIEKKTERYFIQKVSGANFGPSNLLYYEEIFSQMWRQLAVSILLCIC